MIASQSAITAQSQIALLRGEIAERLAKAKVELLNLAVNASDEESNRLVQKIAGLDFVAKSHVEQILLFEYPSEVRRHCAELEDRIHTAGWERNWLEGADLALRYIRDYVR